MPAKLYLGLTILALTLVTMGVLAAGCGPQPLPVEPTPIPTLIPATLPPAPTSPPLPTSSGLSGATVFGERCFTCHNLGDQPKVGPGLAGLFERTALPSGKPVTDENLAEWIRDGGGSMPGFALSDAEMEALIAYLKQETGAAAPEPTAAEKPTTAPAVSADVFEAKCSACHNLTAEAKIGPGLAGLFAQDALPNGQPVTEENLSEWIRNGGGSMPGIALSDTDLEAVIAYLKEVTQ